MCVWGVGGLEKDNKREVWRVEERYWRKKRKEKGGGKEGEGDGGEKGEVNGSGACLR